MSAPDDSDENARLTPGQVELGPVNDKSLPNKLRGANKKGVQRVGLWGPQEGDTGGFRGEIKRVNTFEEAVELLTSDFQRERRYNAVLAAASSAKLKVWNRARRNFRDPDKLVYYVPPAYLLLDPEFDRGHSKTDEGRDGNSVGAERAQSFSEERFTRSFQRVPGKSEEETLRNLLSASRLLCVSEGPGAGKTIFTRRLQAYLCEPAGQAAFFGGQAGLVARFGEGDHRWPTNVRAALEKVAASALRRMPNLNLKASELVDWALAHDRVVLIFDALDQAGDNPRNQDRLVKRVTEFLDNSLPEAGDGELGLRVVLTGRPFSVEERKDGLFRDDRWRFAKIADFGARRQYRYLFAPPTTAADHARTAQEEEALLAEIDRFVTKANGIDEDDCERALANRFPGYESVSELCGNPAVLAMIRELLERGEFVPFSTKSELYRQTSEVMIRRALRKIQGKEPDDDAVERVEEHLRAVAFEWLTRHPGRQRVEGDAEIKPIRQGASGRCEPGMKFADWKLLTRVSALSHRTFLYGSSQKVLAWHHRGVLEFYAGWHLALNTQGAWSKRTRSKKTGAVSIRCGDAAVVSEAANPQWKEVWKFAIDLPKEARRDETLLASLSALFEVPRDLREDERFEVKRYEHDKVANRPTGCVRPTELMWRAWGLLEELPAHELPRANYPPLLRNDRGAPIGGVLIAQYRRQFEDLLNGPAAPPATTLAGSRIPQTNTARQPTADGGVTALHPAASASDAAVARHLLDCFVQCPAGTFDMGSPKGEGASDEHPQHRVQLTAFGLMDRAVTRRHYALFDRHHASHHAAGSHGLNKRTEPDGPIVHVDWHDGWCFARWLGAGYRLPSEAQWEYACRAGTQTKYSFGDELTDTQANFHKSEVVHTTAAGRYPANAWGLFDLHGNVWEWCADWYGSYEASSSPAHNPAGSKWGPSRVLRGASGSTVPGTRVPPTGSTKRHPHGTTT